jgi:solute carrier family 25 uncoupling protein 27
LVQGLYRGLSPALGRHIFYSSIRIATYENLRGVFISPGQDASSVGVGTKMLLGGTAGVIGQVVASPMDLVKVWLFGPA